MTKLLYIGESWLGSCARSLKEAIGRHGEVALDEVNEDDWFPQPRARWLRALYRLTLPAFRSRFERHVLKTVRETRPDAVMAYKGYPIRADLVSAIRAAGALTVNVYPDLSPHAYGAAHRAAVGAYDLVISTKAFHPGLWRQTYGYDNHCLFVPQGYDPLLHFFSQPPTEFSFDLVLVATYRPEYGRLMIDLAKAMSDLRLRVAIGGFGWNSCRAKLPSHWQLFGPVHGRAYLSLLRSGKICLAPLTRDVVINGQRQPGEVDTTRTYELAAAYCFFIHQRTAFASTLYDEREVPMFDDAIQLAGHVRHYLAHEADRKVIADAAHKRAVAAYSLDARAEEIVDLLKRELRERR